ncbi:MAG: ABC transporter ATP-binding protein/permease [Lachnospiraceae bacterium]|nr:ABC transporter ATP-binding protein/permease [Lachnospiraceae bacterium]
MSLLWPIAALIGNYAGNLLPSVIVEGLTQEWQLKELLLRIVILFLIMWLANVASGVEERRGYFDAYTYRLHYSRPYVRKKMRVDYDILESESFQNNAHAAHMAIYSGRGINTIVQSVSSLLSCLFPVLFYGVLLARVQWWIPLLAILSCVFSMQLLSLATKKQGKSYPVQEAYSRKLSYLEESTMEPAAGKDIRLYHMSGWLMKKYRDNLDEMNREYVRVHNWYILTGTGDYLIDLLRNGLIYGYLLYAASCGKMTLAEFVLYFGFVTSFGQYFSLGLNKALSLGAAANVIGSLRKFFDTPEHRNEGETLSAEKAAPSSDTGLTIELKNVSFTYPGQETPVLFHINLTVQAGEKLALIGLNGAGKTTLVKLLCGFYQPTEGEILVNGLPLEKIERRQYYSLLSVLFQDYTILPGTVEENITSTKHPEKAQMERALEKSDFGAVLSKLSQKEKSLLVKEVYDDAVDFSGGEKQRLLLARALYKDARLLILDEPTAALDPIAENEIYLKYGELGEGKTSIFISHRLSSTRFCDRIILLENGQIAEEGTHESLMEAGGKYAELFEMQSRYYREQAREEERRRIMGDEADERRY